jgi:hypothetical protein
MEEKKKSFPRLADIENEVMAEMREWGRKRLEQRLQQLADQHSELFPPPATQTPEPDTAKRNRKNKTHR